MTYSFNEKCIDCEACAPHCSSGAIIVHRDGAHIHCEVDKDLCVSCGHCGKICEKGAVIDNFGKQARHMPKTKWKSPSIDLERCNGCMLCVESCPEYALAMSRPRTQGDVFSFAFLHESEKCMGCGMCADHCPVKAIKMV